MESAMIQKVNSLLDKYIGGEIFFDKLDDAIRTDDNIIKGLLHLSAAICSMPVFGNENNTRIVMSGKTGYAIKEWGLGCRYSSSRWSSQNDRCTSRFC